MTTSAQKLLACIYRTKQRFGASHVIKVLRGSAEKRVLEYKHDQLSTYGIGREWPYRAWSDLVRQLIANHLLQRDSEHGVVSLTPKGVAVMTGKSPFMGALPIMTQTKQKRLDGATDKDGKMLQSSTALTYDLPLFEQLRAKRKELADAASVPPYVIFSDRTLIELATYYPETKEAFFDIHGVGNVKLNKYADVFLPIIQEHCRNNNPSKADHHIKHAFPTRQDIAGRFEDGESIEEIAAACGITRTWVISELNQYVIRGGHLPLNQIIEASRLNKLEQDAVLRAFKVNDTHQVRPIFNAFEGIYPYEEIMLMRMAHVLSAEAALREPTMALSLSTAAEQPARLADSSTDHMLSMFDEAEQVAYLSLLASICYADSQFSDEEKHVLDGLFDSLALSRAGKAHVYAAIFDLQSDLRANHLKSLQILDSSPLRFTLISDLCHMAFSDGHYSPEEDADIMTIGCIGRISNLN